MRGWKKKKRRECDGERWWLVNKQNSMNNLLNSNWIFPFDILFNKGPDSLQNEDRASKSLRFLSFVSTQKEI